MTDLKARQRLVVVGNGMAATRLVEELVRRGAAYDITVVGDEAMPAYNRILLSAVLEGAHPRQEIVLRHDRWYAHHGIRLVTGTRVLRIDRDAGTVLLRGGEMLGYDRLVLATGSVPALPPIRGLVGGDGLLHPRVHAFRSLSDCDRLDQAVPAARRAVVVGGGLLGLQVARALGVRGLQVDVVEGAPHLMASHIGEAAGNVLSRSLRLLGCEVYPQVRAVRLSDSGLHLDTGFVLETDLVVLAAGGRPAISLAKDCGLFVRRGVVVGADLASVSDPRVSAIGDCAEFRGRTTGFVSPAWEQAKILAARLSGGEGEYTGARIVARLRAAGLEVAVLGEPEKATGQVVEMANPVRGSYRKLVVKDGMIQGAVLLGDLSRIGVLTSLYDQRTVLGDQEPGQLLLGDRPPGESSVALSNEDEVCACAGVTAGRIRACSGLADVVARTRATTGCGGCADVVRTLLAGRPGSHASPALTP